MNGIFLDTSAYSDMARGNESVLDAVQTADRVCVNAIVLGELFSGFARGTQESRNTQQLQRFLDSPRCEVLPVVKETALRYGHIHDALRKAGAPVPTNDMWIAATAMEYGLTVVTLDKHFMYMPQILCLLCR